MTELDDTQMKLLKVEVGVMKALAKRLEIHAKEIENDLERLEAEQ